MPCDTSIDPGGVSHAANEVLNAIQVDTGSAVPLHVELRDALAALIGGPCLAPGTRLPTLRQIAASCGVGIYTVSQAIELLQREGRVASRVGRGVFVLKQEETEKRRVVYVCLKSDILNQHVGARFRTLQGLFGKAAELGVELRPVTQGREFNQHIPLGKNEGVLFMDAEFVKEGFGEISAYVLANNVPCCTANNRRPPHPGVEAQHEHAALIATEHLLRLGHRRIALVSKPLKTASKRHALLFSGYVKAIRRYGLPHEPSLVMELPGNVEEGQAALPESLGRFLDHNPRPTAIVSDSDENAMAILDSLRRRGVKVPEEISVVGHENMPAAESCEPPLTTVDAKCPERGEKALEFILAKMDGRDIAAPVVYPELVVRGSTAPCAAVVGGELPSGSQQMVAS